MRIITTAEVLLERDETALRRILIWHWGISEGNYVHQNGLLGPKFHIPRNKNGKVFV